MRALRAPERDRPVNSVGAVNQRSREFEARFSVTMRERPWFLVPRGDRKSDFETEIPAREAHSSQILADKRENAKRREVLPLGGFW
jgi:hypothetical protein